LPFIACCPACRALLGALFSILHLRDNRSTARADGPAAALPAPFKPPEEYLWPTTS
jgi:hypothetical protein